MNIMIIISFTMIGILSIINFILLGVAVYYLNQKITLVTTILANAMSENTGDGGLFDDDSPTAELNKNVIITKKQFIRRGVR